MASPDNMPSARVIDGTSVDGATRPHGLDDPWPAFLDLLDVDREQATSLFHEFFVKLLRASPPSSYWRVSPDRRDDVKQELWLHFWKDDFAKLRRYQNEGRPFAAWFKRVARNWITSWLQHQQRSENVETALPEAESGHEFAATDSPQDEALDRRAMIAAVARCFGQLGARCQALLRLHLEGYRPREICSALRLPADANKKLSDAIRECRRQVAVCVEAHGLDLESWKS